MDRRDWLTHSVRFGGLAVAAVIGVPAAVTALSPALKRSPSRWRPVGNLEQFAIGTVSKALVEVPGDELSNLPQLKGVFVWRESDDDLVVYSRNCTDLSCPVTWDEGSGWFYCPCHGGIFNTRGEPQAGPPSRPLFRYQVRIREGVVEIDLNSLPPMT